MHDIVAGLSVGAMVIPQVGLVLFGSKLSNKFKSTTGRCNSVRLSLMLGQLRRSAGQLVPETVLPSTGQICT